MILSGVCNMCRTILPPQKLHEVKVICWPHADIHFCSECLAKFEKKVFSENENIGEE